MKFCRYNWEQIFSLHAKFRDSRLQITLVLCCWNAVKCRKIDIFEPSSCKNCSIDLKFCMYNLEQVFCLHAKLQDSCLWLTQVLCCKYAVKCCKIAFFEASSCQNCSIVLKFGMYNLKQVFHFHAKLQDSRLQGTLVLCHSYAAKCCKIDFFEPNSCKNCSIDLKLCTDNQEQVFCLRAKYQDSWLWQTLVLCCKYAVKLTFLRLAPAVTAALTQNFACTIQRRWSTFLPNFKTLGYRELWFYTVDML